MAPPKTLDDVELPATKPYRVAMLGCSYFEAEAIYGPTGPGLGHVSKVGTRGQVVNLDEPQARRLLALGAVRETDDARGYDEMNEVELAAQAKARGIDVRSSSLDPAQPLRLDFVAALEAHDAGVASIAPVQTVALPSPDGPRPEHESGRYDDGTGKIVTPSGGTSSDDDGDEFSKLAGKALADAADAAGVDVKTGGSKSNGGLTADEIRDALRAKAREGTAPEASAPEADVVVSGAPAATEANVNALVSYMQRVTPNPEQTVAIAGGTPEGARAVLDAENIITGSDPRGDVASRLQQIIGDAGDGA